MTEDKLEKLIITLGQRLNTQNEILQDIALSLRLIASSSSSAPNYQHDLREFDGFDWASIGAEIVTTDDDGVAVVDWGGKRFTRRAPQNKFGEAIWFSRPVGKEGDSTKYERLITFKSAAEVEPIATKTKAATRAA